MLLTAVGDIRLDGPIGTIAKQSVDAPWRAIAADLSGDIVFGNLECPITTRGEKTPKTWNFRAPAKSLKIVKQAGFTVLNLANNHIWDYGETGFLDTLKAVRKEGFLAIGAGLDRAEAETLRVVEEGGLKIGFLGFTSAFPKEGWAKPGKPGAAYSDFGRLSAVIGKAREGCDLLVVSLHGGTELAAGPNEIQLAFGRAAVDAGADLVLGHHPHVLQSVELYRGKPILHSLGNFLFVSPNPLTRLTTIARIQLESGGVRGIEFVPVDVNWGRLKPAAPEDAQQVFNSLDGLGVLSQHPDRFKVRGITPAILEP